MIYLVIIELTLIITQKQCKLNVSLNELLRRHDLQEWHYNHKDMFLPFYGHSNWLYVVACIDKLQV